jgi:hypothetical protein
MTNWGNSWTMKNWRLVLDNEELEIFPWTMENWRTVLDNEELENFLFNVELENCPITRFVHLSENHTNFRLLCVGKTLIRRKNIV